MHGAILETIECSEDFLPPPGNRPLTLASYAAGPEVEIYLEHTAVGEARTEMPLFLSPDRYINVRLEATYQAAYAGMPKFSRNVLESPDALNNAPGAREPATGRAGFCMPTQGQRIGNFTWVTPHLTIGALGTVATLAAIAWFWQSSLADPTAAPWPATGLITAVGIPIAIACAIWTASQYVLWVEIGERLTFATPLRSHLIPWDAVRGIDFEAETKKLSLVVLPLAVVIARNCIAVITLDGGRELRGRLHRDDALVLEQLLRRYPKLDTRFVRALSSPRTTMKTFVDAVMEDDLWHASKFLDLSKYEERRADRLGADCAIRLKELIDRVWFIDYEEIPDDPDTPSPYVLASGSDQEVDEQLLPLLHAIKISRDALRDIGGSTRRRWPSSSKASRTFEPPFP